MKRAAAGAALLIGLFSAPAGTADPPAAHPVTDQGRLYHGHALTISSPTDATQIRELVREATRHGWQISIAGKRHSQGGQTFGDSTVQIDMLRYHRILHLDTLNRVITVQSGATWKMVQEAANAHHLAVRVMQNSNIFTVGGSISVNAHGPDPREGTILGTIRALRILGPDGVIREASRRDNPGLFRLAVGGYGLFGIILDADIELTGNAIYRRETALLDVATYPAWFAQHVRGHREVGIHYAWLSIDPRSLLREAYTMTYVEVGPRADSVASLASHGDLGVSRFLFGLSRRWDWAKGLRWALQKWIGQPGVPSVCTR